MTALMFLFIPLKPQGNSASLNQSEKIQTRTDVYQPQLLRYSTQYLPSYIDTVQL